jgi:hypothetical protein
MSLALDFQQLRNMETYNRWSTRETRCQKEITYITKTQSVLQKYKMNISFDICTE